MMELLALFHPIVNLGIQIVVEDAGKNEGNQSY